MCHKGRSPAEKSSSELDGTVQNLRLIICARVVQKTFLFFFFLLQYVEKLIINNFECLIDLFSNFFCERMTELLHAKSSYSLLNIISIFTLVSGGGERVQWTAGAVRALVHGVQSPGIHWRHHEAHQTLPGQQEPGRAAVGLLGRR